MKEIIKNLFTPEVITTIISILGAIILASITYSFNKRKEREAEWRKEKLNFYMKFIESLSGITDCEWSAENNIKFAKSCNDLYLFATWKVLSALKEFQNEVRITNQNKSFENYTKTLTDLIFQIRKDMKIKGTNTNDFVVKLRTSGIKNSNNSKDNK